VAIDTDLTKPTLATRFGRKQRVPSLAGDVFISALLRLAEGLGHKPVLFLTQEESVAAVSAARERVSRSFLFSMPDNSVMQMLMDKAQFQQTAERMHCPVPRAVRLTRQGDLRAVEALRFPCVLKPLTRSAAYGSKFAKAYKVSSAGDVGALWSDISKVLSEVIVQEWIEGRDSDVYFCLLYRSCLGGAFVSFVGRKTCQWPPLVGGTASCVPAPETHDELTAQTNRFFDAVGFVGVGSMEYKRDQRDGKFYMVEPTVGRTDHQEEIASLNGVNIPLAAYFGELGQVLPPSSSVSPPRAWRDAISSRRATEAGGVDDIGRIAPTAKICDSYFRIDDPWPYIRLKWQPISRRLSHLRSRPFGA
jgi:predicted ATP-grasp superfamily ATP-dependent carboligase